jgi:hypothetical protein
VQQPVVLERELVVAGRAHLVEASTQGEEVPEAHAMVSEREDETRSARRVRHFQKRRALRANGGARDAAPRRRAARGDVGRAPLRRGVEGRGQTAFPSRHPRTTRALRGKGAANERFLEVDRGDAIRNAT